MRAIAAACLAAVIGLVGAEDVRAAPIKYQWTADVGLLSANREALEAVTGQGVIFHTPTGLWATTGGAFGSFLYDPAAALPAGTSTTGASVYANVHSGWSSTLYDAGGVIGTIRGGNALAVIGNDNSGASLSEDLVNVQTNCGFICGIEPNPWGYEGFTAGSWSALSNSLLWVNGEFLDDQSLPAVLPPIGAPTQVASFGFLMDGTSINAQIIAAGLQIVAVPVPEPATLGMLALGLAGLMLMRRRFNPSRTSPA